MPSSKDVDAGYGQDSAAVNITIGTFLFYAEGHLESLSVSVS